MDRINIQAHGWILCSNGHNNSAKYDKAECTHAAFEWRILFGVSTCMV